jgi:hypothetical protein
MTLVRLCEFFECGLVNEAEFERVKAALVNTLVSEMSAERRATLGNGEGARALPRAPPRRIFDQPWDSLRAGGVGGADGGAAADDLPSDEEDHLEA